MPKTSTMASAPLGSLHTAGLIAGGAGLLGLTAAATALGEVRLAAALVLLLSVAFLCMFNLAWGIVLIPVVYFFRFSLFGLMTPEKAFVAFVLFLWLLSVLLRKRQGWIAPSFPTLIKWVFIFFLFVLLSAGLASGYSVSQTLVKTSQFLFKGLMVYLIYAIVSERSDLKRCLQVLALIVFLYGVGVPWLIVWFGDLQAIRSLEVLYTNSFLFKFTQLKNANGIWRDVLLGLPFVVFLFQEARSRWARGACLLVMGMGSLAVSLTFSRMGWFSLLLTLGLIGLTAKRWGMRLIVLAAAVGFAAFLFINPIAQQRITQKVSQLQYFTKGSFRYRAWRAGYKAFQTSPAVGAGPLSAREVLSRYADFRDFNREHVVAHNPFVEMLVESGIMGLVAFALLWTAAGGVFISSWRRLQDPYYRDAMKAVLISLGVAGVSSLSTGVYLHNLLWYVLGLAFVIPRLDMVERGLSKTAL